MTGLKKLNHHHINLFTLSYLRNVDIDICIISLNWVHNIFILTRSDFARLYNIFDILGFYLL